MIAITSINGFPLPMDHRMQMIQAAGFDAVLMWWGPDEKESRRERVNCARRHSLFIENAHATTDNLNSLWLEGTDGDRTCAELFAEICDCAEYGVRTMVLHLTNGSSPPPVSTIGLNRIEQLVRLAQKKNVRLAFENMRLAEHTCTVLELFRCQHVGFCYDSGHERYWTADMDWLSGYGDRLFAIHLHDNFGDNDSHLIPYDGCIDWPVKLRQIAGTDYSGALAIESEIHASHRYHELGFAGFLSKAYETGRKLEGEIKLERERLRL